MAFNCCLLASFLKKKEKWVRSLDFNDFIIIGGEMAPHKQSADTNIIMTELIYYITHFK